MRTTRAADKRSRENTRARLVEAATEVFAEKALRRVTVDDLVAAAGFSRGAFYSNFASTEEVFYEVHVRQAELMIAAVDQAIDAVPPGEFSLDSLRGVLDALHGFGRGWFLIQTEFTLLAVRDPEARAHYAAHGDRVEQAIETSVRRVLGLLGREPVISVPHLTDVLVGLYLHSLGNEQLETGKLDPQQLVSEVLPQVILGLSRPHG